MHNLFRLSSLASLEGYFYKPRMDRDLLQTYAKGLIATTGCPSGEVQTRLRLGQYEEAKQAAADFRDIFGAENFFCEIMDHGLDIERRIHERPAQAGQGARTCRWWPPTTSTTRTPHDAAGHAALLCVQSGSTPGDPNRFKFDADEFYLKPPAEMRRHLPRPPGGLRQHPADRRALRRRIQRPNANYMPRFPVPEGENEESWFVKEVEKGLHHRYPNGIPDDVRKQADFEVGVITQMGFPGYFLVVADFINWAKNNGIRVGPGRGSGAGSMVAYAMGITDLDPLVHGLIFERFLNPDRVSMPDFDVDFDDRRRGEVIRYVTEKYGDERVAKIVTYGTIKAKQALKDSSRVLGFPFGMGDKLTKAMPPAVMGKDMPLADMFDTEATPLPRGRRLPRAHRVRRRGRDGLRHRAGPREPEAPVGRARGRRHHVVRPADRHHPDHAPRAGRPGRHAVRLPGLRGPRADQDGLPRAAQPHHHRRRRSTTSRSTAAPTRPRGPRPRRPARLRTARPRRHPRGVPARRRADARAAAQMKPDNFEDISAVIALYRPGPMGANSHTNYALRKTGLQEIIPIHPELEEPLADILGGTYGLIVYQEQVMSIAQKLAGFSLGQADLLRRAMGKKKKSELDKQFEGFSGGMMANGYSTEAVKTLWDILLPVLRLRLQQGALGGVRGGVLLDRVPQGALPGRVHGGPADQRRRRQGQARAVPQRVPPHGHHRCCRPTSTSRRVYFAAVGTDIRFGLGAVRNVGFNVVEAMVAARDEQGALRVVPRLPAQGSAPWSATSAPSNR